MLCFFYGNKLIFATAQRDGSYQKNPEERKSDKPRGGGPKLRKSDLKVMILELEVVVL